MDRKEKEQMFKDLEEREKGIYLTPIKNNIERANQKITEYETALQREYTNQRELQIRLIGIQNSEQGTPLTAALKTMPKVIEYIKICDGQIDCAVTTPLTFFESDKFKRIFGSIQAHQRADNVANLLKAIMYDKTIRLTMTELFVIYLNGEVAYKTISGPLS